MLEEQDTDRVVSTTFFFFLAVLGFTLRVSCLLAALLELHPQPFLVYFLGRVLHLPGAAWDGESPTSAY
jgi:hypothetical protein